MKLVEFMCAEKRKQKDASKFICDFCREPIKRPIYRTLYFYYYYYTKSYNNCRQLLHSYIF